MYNQLMNREIIDTAKILSELKKIGITEDNLVAVYLFGSQYWGYANENSDIDFYVIIKKDIGVKQLDLEKISFRYISTLEETKEAILKGSWARFYVLKYASSLLIGKGVELPEFPREKTLEYLDGKRVDVEKILQSPLKWGYITLMIRVFLINYLFQNSTSFNLKSFEECKVLEEEDKRFIAMLYENLFNHKDVSTEDKERIIEIIERLEGYIRGNI